jgi:hypothetical protein
MECIGEGFLVSKASPNLRVVALRVIGKGVGPKITGDQWEQVHFGIFSHN